MTHPRNVETKEAAGEERERPKISETNTPAKCFEDNSMSFHNDDGATGDYSYPRRNGT